MLGEAIVLPFSSQLKAPVSAAMVTKHKRGNIIQVITDQVNATANL